MGPHPLSSQGDEMNQERIERWQAEFETVDAETVRQMLAEARATKKLSTLSSDK